MPTRSPTVRLLPHLRRAALASADAGLSDGQLLGEFLQAKDEAAFAALVRRHGPMVLGVCRRVVGDAHVAEDAFQAVFLVLARRAAAVRPREQLGNWLYGVAYRTGLKARSVLARRRAKEKQVDAMPHPEVPPHDAWPDLQPVLDAELARLPDKFRLPVVLCDLEGRTQREVAKQLGLPPATLANRLASARRTLAARLTSRGVTLSGGALATVVSANAAQAVPPTLAAAAVRTLGAITGAGVVPAHVAHLSEGVIRMLLLTKLKAATVAVLAAAVVAGGFGLGTLPAVKADDGPAPKAAPAKPAVGPHLSDKEFLTRVCLDLRGNLPTDAEMGYFLADADPAKRKKVVGWLTDDKPVAVASDTSVRLNTLTADSVWVDGGRVQLNETYYDLAVRNPPLVGLEMRRNVVGTAILGDVPYTVLVDGTVKGVWDLDEPHAVLTWFLGASPPMAVGNTWAYLAAADPDPDEAFLNRVSQDLRGTAPTRVELEYFKADTDPKKREKLLDLMLKDPELAKKATDAWKRQVLGVSVHTTLRLRGHLRANAVRVWLAVDRDGPPARLDALLGQLLDAKRPDDQVLDALASAALGRLPTESERKLILAQVAKGSDKRAAWREVLTTLAGTDEAKKHAEELKGK